MNKLDKNTFVPIGVAIAVALFAMSLAAKTSSRFVSLEKDVMYYAKHVEHLIFEVRSMRDEVKKLSVKIETLEEKINN